MTRKRKQYRVRDIQTETLIEAETEHDIDTDAEAQAEIEIDAKNQYRDKGQDRGTYKDHERKRDGDPDSQQPSEGGSPANVIL